jgi:hypothetical protein
MTRCTICGVVDTRWGSSPRKPSRSRSLRGKGDRSVQCLVAQNFKASFHDLILLAVADTFTTFSCHRHRRHDHRHYDHRHRRH